MDKISKTLGMSINEFYMDILSCKSENDLLTIFTFLKDNNLITRDKDRFYLNFNFDESDSDSDIETIQNNVIY